ncbi:hypothetical protein WME73_19275 [Sorangium sp. So ce302]|uniref:hypothetical protein n=1 Tax=Sorangium sp. So ce302 TaxID=3133297 RepID=UPI003F61304B
MGRPWAELLRHTFAIDVLECPSCNGGVMEPPCPSEFPERFDMFRFVSGCGTCDCGFDGEPCSMEFSFYRDQACSDLVLTQTLTTERVCADLAKPVAIGGVKLRVLAEGHGDCTNHGRVRIAEGEKIKPTWGETFCSRALSGGSSPRVCDGARPTRPAEKEVPRRS